MKTYLPAFIFVMTTTALVACASPDDESSVDGATALSGDQTVDRFTGVFTVPTANGDVVFDFQVTACPGAVFGDPAKDKVWFTSKPRPSEAMKAGGSTPDDILLSYVEGARCACLSYQGVDAANFGYSVEFDPENSRDTVEDQARLKMKQTSGTNTWVDNDVSDMKRSKVAPSADLVKACKRPAIAWKP